MTRRSVEILEGNETIRRIMAQTLRDVGVDVVSRSGETDAPDELCDALIVDVDSGAPGASQRASNYLDDDRAVLYCGLRDSRSDYSDHIWIDRPFTPTTFLTEMVDVLGLSAQEISRLAEDTADDHAPVPPEVDADEDEPITRELAYDEAQELEKRLGLNPGVLGTGSVHSEPTVSDEEAFEVLDIDDSAVMVEDELQFALGGEMAGGVESRRVESDELVAGREADIQVRGLRSPTFNQTMPDTPTALGSEDETQGMRVPIDLGQPIDDSSDASADVDTSSEGSDLVLPAAASGADLAVQIKGVARMLAESWQRIALTSRTDDRADRIERVLTAAVTKGLRGAAREVQRIPPAAGFAGGLSSLTFVDTVRTIRDRKLRGRLEVAFGDEAFVLHVEGPYLEAIDTLSGDVDGMLLDILHQGGALDETQYKELWEAYEAGQFVGPLELELGRQGVVSDAALQSARVVRARELFRRLCASRGGQFAFLEIGPGDGQPWPVHPLRINVDQLLLELLRESSIDTGDSRATARTRLVLDPNRAASLHQHRLTEEERSVMMFFKDGDTLASARERLQKKAGPEEVDRIVDRLKKVELLKRSDPEIPVPPGVGKKSSTVVSDVSDVISQDERARGGQDDKTTSLKPNWDIDLPDPLDTDEVDRMVEEAIAKYESEASEAAESSDDLSKASSEASDDNND